MTFIDNILYYIILYYTRRVVFLILSTRKCHGSGRIVRVKSRELIGPLKMELELE